MLKLRIPVSESFDEATKKFITEFFDLELEHSLVSLSKWESEWEKPFLTGVDKTPDEVLSYIQHMIVTPNAPSEILNNFTKEHFEAVRDHIDKKHTATWFSNSGTVKKNAEVTTSEVIYHWMTALNIPMECENWHLNRLLTLVKVADEKSKPPKKQSKADLIERNRRINEANRAKYNSKG